MKKISEASGLREQALQAIDKYLSFESNSGCQDIGQALLGIMPGRVTEWQSGAIFARDTLQRIHDKILAGTVESIDFEDLSLLNRLISFYELIHYEPYRQAEMEKFVLQGFRTAYDDEQLTSMIELYELRAKAVALEARIQDIRIAKSNKEAA